MESVIINTQLNSPGILVVVHSLRGGGAERSAIILVRALTKLGHTACLGVVVREGELLQLARETSIPIVPLTERKWFPRARILRAIDVVIAVRRQNPAILILNSWPSSELLLLAKQFRLISSQLIYVVHNSPVEELSTIASSKAARKLIVIALRKLLYVANDVVAVSQGVATNLRILFRTPRLPVHVIHNPVDDTDGKLPKGVPAHELLAGVKHPLLVSVGRLEPQKNHELLLRAFARLDRSERGTLIIAGEGSLRDRLETIALELGISADSHFLGFVDDASVLMRFADAVVMSSAWEGFPRVHLEAAALGKLVISTDCPSGPAEIAVQYPDRIRLVPNGDEQALATALQEFSYEYHAGQSTDYLAYVPESFRPEFYAKSFADLFQPF